MNILKELKSKGIEKTLNDLKRLSEEDFDSKIANQNLFSYLGITSDEWETIEYVLFPQEPFLLGKIIRKIIPDSYRNYDYCIDGNGNFEWD